LSKFDVNITKYYSLFTSESSSSYCVNNLNFPANADQIDKAKDLIKKLAFSFNSEGFENPVLQKYWRNIEALALDRDEPEEMVDYTSKCYYTR
jgi:hypothetical protein